jgi:hypothetical protein
MREFTGHLLPCLVLVAALLVAAPASAENHFGICSGITSCWERERCWCDYEEAFCNLECAGQAGCGPSCRTQYVGCLTRVTDTCDSEAYLRAGEDRSE